MANRRDTLVRAHACAWFLGVLGALARPAAAADPVRGAVSTAWSVNWEDGMVSGNGRMGAMVYGKPEAPVILVNHDRLYTAEYDPAGVGPAHTAQYLPEIRRIIREQGYKAALDFTYRNSKENGLAKPEAVDYHPGFFLNLHIDGADQASDYRRSENFQTGEVEMTWRGRTGPFRLRTFVSRADNVVVLRLSRPAAGQLDCDLGFAPVGNKLVRSRPEHGNDWIGFENLYAPGNGGYDGVVRVVARGGSVTTDPDRVAVHGADELTALMQIERFRPPQTVAAAAVASALGALPADYATLLAAHVKIHGELFDRVRLDLGGGADRSLTTDVLLDRATREKRVSPALMEKIYDACRYVVLCSSGDLPPNLQGIWNGSWHPQWHGDYSADANLQLAVDSMCSANMPELMRGFFDLIEAGVPSWQAGARDLAGCRGILYPARMQDRGTYFQQTHDWPWYNQVAIAGWLGHYFYDYYRYTGDRAFLRDHAVPYLKQCALFYEDWYLRDPDGRLRASPSMSYESAYADNATNDFAVAREVLTNLIAGCQTLGVEADGVVRWQALLARIPPYMVNTPQTDVPPPPPYEFMERGVPAAADGTLKEFILPDMAEFPAHRHLSHLYPLFVSYEFGPEQTPDLWRAATLAYERKIRSCTITASHYRLQASLCAARLGRGDDASRFLDLMAANGVFHASLVPSHYDHRQVFNVDASGGVPSVVDNCLIFSMPGRIDLLPALPSAWPAGRVGGLLARGQVAVTDLTWDLTAGRVSAELTSGTEQQVTVSLPPRSAHPALSIDGTAKPVTPVGTDRQGCVVSLPKGRSRIELHFDPKR